ncbi:hypothetical protein B6A27_05185 [Anoxybacillus sp. UARK-01]|uniref:DUF418 domain-containing protein n=1 Tax=Anoxybacteroides rupiense TaxID=311460 RepID=A0ABD5IVI6_9BACL|nr:MULTISPECIES: DUF418 domain-containing protein [Anoxybacillus]MED5051819.1 DUF418 domain-containing protein [Anoxybacillus rupiensis]OQM46555.1 hypothetical protein B6A27_05185 [Anoxybacillus sp. UARK-01]
MSEFHSISDTERIQSVDMMRGIAILGIFLVNMPHFNSPIMYLSHGSGSSHASDRLTEKMIDIFAEASFYPLFAFLFGFGVIIFRERVLMKKRPFVRLFARRMISLLLIGCLHAFLIWYGDILISYALTGMFMLLFHRASPRSLFVWALLLWLVPNGLLSALLGIAVWIEPGNSDAPSDETLAHEALHHYRDGTFAEIFQQRWHDWMYVNNAEGTIFIILSLLPMFLFGAYVAKQQWFSSISANKKTLKKLWIFTLLFGWSLKLLPYWAERNMATEYVQNMLGGPLTSIFYVTTIALCSDMRWGNKILSIFAAVGKMSLTNYLFQSILCTLLFYHYGFGLYGTVRPFYGLLLAIFIYSLQVVISNRWMKRYRTGPVEWLWRTIIYGQKQPFKRT